MRVQAGKVTYSGSGRRNMAGNFPKLAFIIYMKLIVRRHMGITAARLQLVFAGKILVYIIQQEF